MSITTYTELQSAIQNWIARTDLAASVPDWITLFEAEANRRLRVQQQEIVTTLTPVSGSVALPSDYLSWRRVTWAGSPLMELEYVTPDYFNWRFQGSAGAIPEVFTIEGNNLKVAPGNDTSLLFGYFQAIPSLASAGTNWLLTDHPDCYMQGSLVEAYDFMRDQDETLRRAIRRDAIFDSIITLSNKTRGVGGMRVLGPTP